MPEHLINDEKIFSNINISNSNYRLQRLTKLFIEFSLISDPLSMRHCNVFIYTHTGIKCIQDGYATLIF